MKLDLACGDRLHDGFIGVDINKMNGETVVFDLLSEEKWPWDDNSVEEAYCQHFVEHIETPRQFEHFFNELHRVLQVGAKCTIICPYWSSIRCFQDYTHRRAISEASFLYVNKNWRQQEKLSKQYGMTCDFDFTYGYGLNEASGIRLRNTETQQFMIRHYLNVVDDGIYTLIKRPPSNMICETCKCELVLSPTDLQICAFCKGINLKKI